MIKLIICIVVLFFANTAMAELEPDKELHLKVSFIAGMASYAVLRANHINRHKAAVYSFTLVMVAGLAKEILIDDHADVGDIAYNALGASSGILIPFVLTF